MQLVYSDDVNDTTTRVAYAMAAERCREAGGVLASVVDERLNARLSQVFGCALGSSPLARRPRHRLNSWTVWCVRVQTEESLRQLDRPREDFTR